MPHDANQQVILAFVKGTYDLQKLRISVGNRLCANFRSKVGIPPGTKEEDADDEAQKIMQMIRASYDKITEGVKKEIPTMTKFKGDELISEYSELCLVHQWVELKRREESHFRRMEDLLESFPIYNEFLKKVHGCGAAMSGVIISMFDPHKANYRSSFWKYSGFDVGPDGKGRSKRKEHLVDRKYINKAGEEATKKSITYDPWLKTKMYVLGTCLIRSGSEYKSIYEGYKNRLENRVDTSEWTKLHKHRASLRFMIKIFLANLWEKWRTLEGLPLNSWYCEEKLGIVVNHPIPYSDSVTEKKVS